MQTQTTTKTGTTNNKTQTTNKVMKTQTTNKQETNKQEILNATCKALHKGLNIAYAKNPTLNYAKNTVAHSKAKNTVAFAPIYTGNGKYTFISVGTQIITPSGMVVTITQLITKNSAEIGTTFKGTQFYQKWQTNNGLFSGGHFAKYNGIKWGIALNSKGTPINNVAKLNLATAISLLKIVGIKARNINNMPKK